MLAVDVGNSRIKLGWFATADADCVERAGAALLPIAGHRAPEPADTLALTVEELSGGRLAEWLGTLPTGAAPRRVVVASVCEPAAATLESAIGDPWRVERLASESAPITLRVDEPSRVGADRVVAAVAANRLRRADRAAIVVDIGTAITVDLVAADGALEGGAILPGPGLSARALAEATHALPDVRLGELDASPDALGRATESAIHAGIFWGAVGAIRELIERQSDRLTHSPQVFVTGGAAPGFTRLLGGPRRGGSAHAPPDAVGHRDRSGDRRRMTRVALLTPPGRGAIAVVEVVGPGAAAAVGQSFAPAAGGDFVSSPVDRIRFGRWASGEEVVAVRTDADRVEVHCHGGFAASAAVLRDLVVAGAIAAEAEVVSLEDDARRLLAEAGAGRVAAVLLDQVNGALSARIGEAADAAAAGRLDEARSIVDSMVAWRALGPRLTRPWRVVLTGPPNVGKSRLANALVGYERAIVYDRPGTTRDVVTASTAVGGWPIVLADTAGVRETDDPLEAAGVVRAREALARADIVVVVREATSLGAGDGGKAGLAKPRAAGWVRVASKADLAPGFRAPAGWLSTSAATGEGIDALLAAIEREVCPRAPAPGEAVPLRRATVQRLEDAAAHLCGGDGPAAVAALRAALAPITD